MAVQPFERMVPVARSPYSFFEPSWEVGRWSDFSDINFNWQQQFRAMERQMREMERQMEEMFVRFRRLAPIEPGPMMPYQPIFTEGRERRTEQRPDQWQNAEQFQFDNPIVNEKDGSRKLKLNFDVRQFKPEEVSVKTMDQHLIVHAKHKEDSDTSKVYREYNRQFLLPPSVNPEMLKSVLSPEGVLSIEAPVNAALEGPQERLIPIEHSKTKPAIGSTGAHQQH